MSKLDTIITTKTLEKFSFIFLFDHLGVVPHHWPPRSPDLTVCDFFLWGFIKDIVYVAPLPATLAELKVRITTAVEGVDADMLAKVWDEFNYRTDICRASNGGHIEHL